MSSIFLYKCCHPVELIKQNQSGKGRKRTSTEPGGGLAFHVHSPHSEDAKKNFFLNTNSSEHSVWSNTILLNHHWSVGCLLQDFIYDVRVYLEKKKREESQRAISLCGRPPLVYRDPPSPTLREKEKTPTIHIEG